MDSELKEWLFYKKWEAKFTPKEYRKKYYPYDLEFELLGKITECKERKKEKRLEKRLEKSLTRSLFKNFT